MATLMATMMEGLKQSILQIPAGKWVVGVSGGADSTALLRLAHARSDLHLFVAHLNHETRGVDSDGDETFVCELSASLGLTCESARLSSLGPIETTSTNPSAMYRAARHQLFRRVTQQHACSGVLLAHHAMDQSETVFQRLLRGSGYFGLTGIARSSVIQGLTIHRPLLGIIPMHLREYLRSIGQTWRHDASNESDKYSRNRVRKLLILYPSIVTAIDDLRERCRALDHWVQQVAPTLDRRFPAKDLANLSTLLARESAIRWLIDIGCPPESLEPQVIDRLIQMTRDAATPSKQSFPGQILVTRNAGWVSS